MGEPRVVKQSDIDWLLSFRIVNAERAIEEMKRDGVIVVIDDKELLLDHLSRRGSRPEVSVPVGQVIMSSEDCESIIRTQTTLLQTFKIAVKYGIVKVVNREPRKRIGSKRKIARKKKVLQVSHKELDEEIAKYSDPQTREYVKEQLEALIKDGEIVVVADK